MKVGAGITGHVPILFYTKGVLRLPLFCIREALIQP